MSALRKVREPAGLRRWHQGPGECRLTLERVLDVSRATRREATAKGHPIGVKDRPPIFVEAWQRSSLA